MIATLTVCSLDFDEDYIDHFIDFYDSQEVDYHILIIHSKEPVNEDTFRDYYSTKRVLIFFLYGMWNSKIAQEKKHSIIKELNLGENDWLIHADIDEHAESKNKTLRQKISEMIDNGENCCFGIMTDRIASDGSLPPILKTKTLSEQFPTVVNLTRAVLKGLTRKIPITRADIGVLGGSHDVVPEDLEKIVINDEVLVVNHYKWTKKVKEKLEERVKTHKEFYHWRESDRFLKFWGKFQTIKPRHV